MPQTIDLQPVEGQSGTHHFVPDEVPDSWAEVARMYGVDPKTIERDRKSLGRFEEDINPDLLEWIRRMRRWCDRGNGGGPFTRRKFMSRKDKGTLEQKLEELGII